MPCSAGDAARIGMDARRLMEAPAIVDGGSSFDLVVCPETVNAGLRCFPSRRLLFAGRRGALAALDV